MIKFLKMLGFGAIYTLLSPFIVVFFVLYTIYCLGVFLYMSIRNLIVFFAGGNPMGDLPEDVKAKKIAQQKQLAEAQALANNVQQQPMVNNVTQNFYQQPVQNLYQNNQQPQQVMPNQFSNTVNATPIEQAKPELIDFKDYQDDEENTNDMNEFGGDK